MALSGSLVISLAAQEAPNTPSATRRCLQDSVVLARPTAMLT